jgi:beta-galactosidase
MRNEILLNDGWLFHKGDIKVERGIDKGPMYSQAKTERKQIGPAAYCYNDIPDPYNHLKPATTLLTYEHWEVVQLPHDYIVDQDFSADRNNCHGYVEYDNAWYRKHFKLPEGSENKRVMLRFDGIATASDIYLNGCIMRHNYSAYNTIEIDISDYVFYDRENVIAVYVSTEDFEGWWYQGGGIYRDVYLTITEPVAIDLYGVYAPYKKLDDNTWQIDYETTVLNTSYEDVSVKAVTKLIDKYNAIAVSQYTDIAHSNILLS